MTVGDADFMYCVCAFFVLAETEQGNVKATTTAREAVQRDALSMLVMDASR